MPKLRIEILDNDSDRTRSAGLRQPAGWPFQTEAATEAGDEARWASRLDPAERGAKVAERAGVDREGERRLVGDPERGVTVVGAADVVIVVAGHVPEHAAKLVEVEAGHPVGAIPAEANHADLRDVRVIDRRQPADLGHRAWVGGTELDLDLVRVGNDDPASGRARLLPRNSMR